MTAVHLRFAAAVLALGAGAAAIVVAALLLRSTPGPVAASSSPLPAAAPSASAARASIAGGRIAVPNDAAFPSPPPGALVLSREAGVYALGLAIRGRLVRVSVLSGAGPGAAGLRVRIGKTTLAPCGAGCYQATLPPPPHGTVAVSIGARTYRFSLPARTTDGATILARASATWRGLKSLVWRERLASSPALALNTIYEAIAPDVLAYQVHGHGDAVIIGTRRWDRSSNGPWERSVQEPPVRQPVPYWQTWQDARVIATTRFDGHPVWRVAFFDPQTPGWFTADVDRHTYRTLQLQMIAAAHFMHHVYGPFDAPITIKPPT